MLIRIRIEEEPGYALYEMQLRLSNKTQHPKCLHAATSADIRDVPDSRSHFFTTAALAVKRIAIYYDLTGTWAILTVEPHMVFHKPNYDAKPLF